MLAKPSPSALNAFSTVTQLSVSFEIIIGNHWKGRRFMLNSQTLLLELRNRV